MSTFYSHLTANAQVIFADRTTMLATIEQNPGNIIPETSTRFQRALFKANGFGPKKSIL
ncbi:hypothetical protein SH528x_003258 [Novipirellula sp. SH528]|uniref:hypothetical protein n=1 Tax=Novipirellula sp. SH528 TaxID=3454466 RepID=UPI003F9F22BA